MNLLDLELSPLPFKEVRKLKVLDFDIENRPLSYWYDGNCTAEITAIATSWLDNNDVDVWLLGKDDPVDMLDAFIEKYNEADVVTGHYIRKHDLPIINGALFEYGLPLLSGKLTSDTKLDLLKTNSISVSQESIASYLGLPEPKHHMDQHAWRTANRLTPEGIEKTRKRVVDDVLQHKAVRAELIRRGALGPLVWWESDTAVPDGKYRP